MSNKKTISKKSTKKVNKKVNKKVSKADNSTSRFGHRKESTLGLLDELFWKGVTTKEAIMEITKAFPKKYPKTKEGQRRAEGRLIRHYRDMNNGNANNGKKIRIIHDEKSDKFRVAKK